MKSELAPSAFSLEGKKGLVIGIANEHSVAYGCARAFRAGGARLAVTYLNEKAERFVRPLAQSLDAELILPLDVTKSESEARVFAEVAELWGGFDFLLHSIAFCPLTDLHAPVFETSREGFLMAMDISCHSFLRAIRLSKPLMREGGTALTISFFGAERAVEHYNIMGPVKAALEAAVRYAAKDLGPEGIRVHALSPGPLRTRAASGIGGFEEIIENYIERSPQRRLVTIEDVGAFARFLVSDAACNMTGGVHYIDAGFHAVA